MKKRILYVLSVVLEFLAITLAVFYAHEGHAAPPWKREPALTNGCPAGTTSAVLSADGSTLSILFDQFVVEAGGGSGKMSDGKFCDLKVPIDVPQGFRMGVYRVDYRGYANLPHQGEMTLLVDYNFDGGRAPGFHRRLNGQQEGDFLLTDTLGAGHMKWTGCGGTVVMDFHAQLLLNLKRNNGQAMAVLDSADGAPKKGGIVYTLQLRKCD